MTLVGFKKLAPGAKPNAYALGIVGISKNEEREGWTHEPVFTLTAQEIELLKNAETGA